MITIWESGCSCTSRKSGTLVLSDVDVKRARLEHDIEEQSSRHNVVIQYFNIGIVVSQRVFDALGGEPAE
jgi:hypothetical protein